MTYFQGGGPWTAIPPPLGVQALKQERADLSGWTAEMVIPFADLAGITGQGDVVGIGFLDYSEPTKTWANFPYFATTDNASSWANGVFSTCWPNPDFQTLPTCLGTTTVFQDLSLNNPDQWFWFFGDGPPIVTLQSPRHTDGLAGTYSVNAVATARLSESRRPAIGMTTSRVQAAVSSSLRPGPSRPITISTGSFRFAVRKSSLASR